MKPKGRREEQKEKRRNDIVAMAIEVFAEKGFHKTDVQVIADKLNIGKGTVYRYFPSKNELFFGCVEFGVLQIAQQLEQAFASHADPVEGISAGIFAYLSFFQQNPDLVEIFIQERAVFKEKKLQEYALEHNDQQQYIEGLELLQKQGVIRNDIPARSVLEFADTIVPGTMYQNHFRKDSIDIQTQVDQIMTIFLHGILSPED